MHKMGAKGQVVIEREIRERLGVGPGWRAVQHLKGDHVEIYFLPPEHSRSLAGSLNAYLQRRAPTDEALRDAREAAREAEAAAREQR